MAPKPIPAAECTRDVPAETACPSNESSEIETEWHTALQGELSQMVPSKLPISQLPVRTAA